VNIVWARCAGRPLAELTRTGRNDGTHSILVLLMPICRTKSTGAPNRRWSRGRAGDVTKEERLEWKHVGFGATAPSSWTGALLQLGA
jgi:hypothetical protein